MVQGLPFHTPLSAAPFSPAFPVALTGFICSVGSRGGARDEILLARRLEEHEGFISES